MFQRRLALSGDRRSRVTEHAHSSHVLTVDDTPKSLRVPGELLECGDFVARPATNGRQALEASLATPLAVILAVHRRDQTQRLPDLRARRWQRHLFLVSTTH